MMLRINILFLLLLISNFIHAQLNQGKKILIVATSADNLLTKPDQHTWGCFAPEITEFFSVLNQAGFRAKNFDIVSSKGGAIPLAYPGTYPGKFNVDEENKKEFEYKLKNSLLPSQVNAGDYNVIYYSGGFSCLVDYPESKEVAALATKIYESGGIVGAVCDGIAGLIPIKSNNETFLVANKKITTNGFKKKNDLVSKTLIQQGADITASKVVNENSLDLVLGRCLRAACAAEQCHQPQRAAKQRPQGPVQNRHASFP